MTIALQPSRLFRHVLTAVLALLFMAWLHVAHADTVVPSPAQADFEKLQEQVRTLDKDNAVLAAKIEAQNNCIADLSLAATQHGNHIAAVSNQTTTLGNYIGIGGVFITVLLVVTGVFTYKNAQAEAKEAAKQEAQAWIAQHAAQLTQQVADLEAKVQKATQDIDGHAKTVAKAASDAKTKIEDDAATVRKAADVLLRTEKAGSGNTADPEAAQQITRISEELKAKPENEFTSADHFARGLALFNAENYEGALASFRAASSEPTLSATDAARYLNAQGIALVRLDRGSHAIDVYDELVQRFGDDSSPGVREQVASAMLNRSVEIGKIHGPDKAYGAYDELVHRFGNDNSPSVRERVASAMFNRSVAIGKLHGPEKAIDASDELVHRFGDDSSPSVRKRVARAMLHRGVHIGMLHGPEKSIAAYDELLQRFGAENSPGVREEVAKAMFNRGVEIGKLQGREKEIAAFDELMQRFGDDSNPGVSEQVANAKNGAAYNSMLLAKANWNQAPLRAQHLQRIPLYTSTTIAAVH